MVLHIPLVQRVHLVALLHSKLPVYCPNTPQAYLNHHSRVKMELRNLRVAIDFSRVALHSSRILSVGCNATSDVSGLTVIPYPQPGNSRLLSFASLPIVRIAGLFDDT